MCADAVDVRRAPSLSAAQVVASFDGPTGAYVHVPFCERICPFCPYNKVVAEETLARRYFAALRQEVDGYVAELGGPFTSVYVGGGTPTLYPDDLADLLARIPASGERAVEVLPTHATPEGLDRLAAAGFTAVSIGAQSFHDGVLRQLRRPHDAATARAGVENSLGRFDCVDVDLIFDVAWEDDQAFLEDLRTCFELGVDQVSTYPLMRFGYTPFGTAQHDRRREHAVLRRATDLAESLGYERQSVWTFNRPGSAPYTSITRHRFLGMGAGSSSFAGRDFYVNHFGVEAYVDAVGSGRLPIARRLRLGRWGGGAYDAFWEAYSGRIDPTLLGESYGPAVAGVARALLSPLLLAGDLRRDEDGYHLTRNGFDVYHDLERAVTYQLIEPLWAEMLAEHDRTGSVGGPASCAGSDASRRHARWARPDRARHGRAWSLARLLLERPS